MYKLLPSNGDFATRRVVLDMAGRGVSLPGQVHRVCSNGISLNQLLLTLGATERMVATVPEVRKNPWFVRLAPRIAHLPVPFSTHGGLDVGGLLCLNPDLVVVWNDDALARRLRSMEIAVLVVHFSTPEEFRRAVVVLATALGGNATDRARHFCARYDSLRTLVKSHLAGLSAMQRQRVFYSADGVLSTEGTASIVTSWIEEAGGVNVAAQAGVHGARVPVSAERLLAWDPQVIFVRDSADREVFLTDPRWARLAAVRERRVHSVPRAVNAWSTRNGESLLQPLWAAKTLHRERFEDVPMEPIVHDFFHEFYGTAIDDDDIAAVLSGKAPAADRP